MPALEDGADPSGAGWPAADLARVHGYRQTVRPARRQRWRGSRVPAPEGLLDEELDGQSSGAPDSLRAIFPVVDLFVLDQGTIEGANPALERTPGHGVVELPVSEQPAWFQLVVMVLQPLRLCRDPATTTCSGRAPLTRPGARIRASAGFSDAHALRPYREHVRPVLAAARQTKIPARRYRAAATIIALGPRTVQIS
jgi:hypothetical protein